MSVSPKERLIKEILGSDDVARLRRASLENGLVSLRARRRRRAAVRMIALSCIPPLLTIGLMLHLSREFDLQHSSRTNAASPLTSDGPQRIRVVTDDELLALFPDRPVALIGKPGQQQLVFLDTIDSIDQP